MKFISLLDQLAVDLNDAAPGHEFTSWSREQIRAYLEEAIQMAFTGRPDLFNTIRILKVEPCSILQDTCDCTKIRRVLGQSTKDGRIIKELRRKSNDDNLRWTGRTCSSDPRTFELKEYSIDNETDKLWLYPQVPPGKEVYVTIECTVIPENIADDYDVPAELVAPVRQWVLWLAKIWDGENNQLIVAVADKHQDTFWKLMDYQKQNDEYRAEEDDA